MPSDYSAYWVTPTQRDLRKRFTDQHAAYTTPFFPD